MEKTSGKITLVSILILFVHFCFSQNLEERLDELSKKYSFTFEKMKAGEFFVDKYLLLFQQLVNHDDTSGKYFSQRVFLSHLGFEQPVVFITEGYGADYASNPKYVNELCRILNGNQVCVEHRFFSPSIPEPIDWEHLTIYNAATDHHKIAEALKEIYNGKWINTGISKGGQAMMYHRYFYPDDVDASVGYVCPLNFSIEDKRVYGFLEQVGDADCREKILNYQLEMLRNKARYLPEFLRTVEKKNLSYPIENQKAYDLLVFEYSFAFWQWGDTDCQNIAFTPENPENMVEHLDKITGIDWISDQELSKIFPFFYQAMTEIGFYGYNIAPFAEYTYFSANPDFTFTIPDNMTLEYNPVPMQKVDQFIRHEAENMIFIYGESDPWSATAVDLTYNTNSIKIVKPGGNHNTRIENLPDDQKNRVIEVLKNWLEMSD